MIDSSAGFFSFHFLFFFFKCEQNPSEVRVMSLNCIFCPTNSPKPPKLNIYCQKQQNNEQIVTFKKLEQTMFDIFYWKRSINYQKQL